MLHRAFISQEDKKPVQSERVPYELTLCGCPAMKPPKQMELSVGRSQEDDVVTYISFTGSPVIGACVLFIHLSTQNCVYLVKNHCQAPCMRVNKSFLLVTWRRKRVSLLTVEGETALCTRQIKSHNAFNFTESTQDLAEAMLAFQAIWLLPMWFLMALHHFNSFQKT